MDSRDMTRSEAVARTIRRLREERDRYRAVVRAAGEFVSSYGLCDDAGPNEPYCDLDGCDYCALGKALDKT